MGTNRSDLISLKLAVDQLKVLTEKKVNELCASVAGAVEAYDSAVVAAIPTWRDAQLPNVDAVPEMEDNAFIAMRRNMRREKDLSKRMAAAAALVRVVAAAIVDRQKRAKALEARAKGGAENDAEVKVARRRLAYVGELVKALRKRLIACITDFAVARHQALSAVCAATNAVEELFPGGDDTVAALFCGAKADSGSAIELICESEKRLKAGKRKTVASTAFGERGKRK